MFCKIPVQHNNTLTEHNVEMVVGMYSRKISSASLCTCNKLVGGGATLESAFTSSHRSKYCYHRHLERQNEWTYILASQTPHC